MAVEGSGRVWVPEATSRAAAGQTTRWYVVSEPASQAVFETRKEHLVCHS
jgi:hypothetical protein